VSPSPPMADLSPSDCERIIIVGAGGFGREVLQWARDTWPAHQDKIAGFLSDDPRRLDGTSCRLPILADPAAFAPREGDYLLLAIGIPGVRRHVAEDLLARGGKFLTMIHPTAALACSAEVEQGSIICPMTIVSDSARIRRFCLVNFFASLGHDSMVDDFAVLSPYATLGGEAVVEDDCFLATHAFVGPRCVLGARSYVSANSCLLTSAPPDTLVHGVPGRITAKVCLSGGGGGRAGSAG
jgi:sugar O-acyltransferase (sialic acid O-acetyltransferase NeuD family)